MHYKRLSFTQNHIIMPQAHNECLRAENSGTYKSNQQTWMVPRETAAVSAHVLRAPYNHAPQCHFIPSHIQRVHVCLAVNCHLYFWQNGRDLLRNILQKQSLRLWFFVPAAMKSIWQILTAWPCRIIMDGSLACFHHWTFCMSLVHSPTPVSGCKSFSRSES